MLETTTTPAPAPILPPPTSREADRLHRDWRDAFERIVAARPDLPRVIAAHRAAMQVGEGER